MSLVRQYTIGSVVRYADGITALMQVTGARYDHGGKGDHLYTGNQFYGGLVNAYHGDCKDATHAELHLWEQHHKKEKLRAAARQAINSIDEAMRNLPAKGDCANYLTMARSKIQCAIEESAS